MKRPRAGYIATMYIETRWKLWIIGGRTIFVLLALMCTSYAATPTLPPVLTLQEALRRVGLVYVFDCHLKVPGTATLDFYEALNAKPYASKTVALADMPVSQAVYSGGTANVYIRVTCTATSGSPQTASATFKFHYPDAPVTIGPSAPTGIKVI